MNFIDFILEEEGIKMFEEIVLTFDNMEKELKMCFRKQYGGEIEKFAF
jgi:hypothetical protein